MNRYELAQLIFTSAEWDMEHKLAYIEKELGIDLESLLEQEILCQESAEKNPS